MSGDLGTVAMALGWCVGLIALFTFLSVAAWTSARRKERDAYYKSEAIKKIAEMQGTTPEPVLQILRETMAAWKDNPSPANMGPYQAKAYYRAETIKKIADMQGAGADSVLNVLREEEKISARRTREGLKLAGFITCAVGLGLLVILRAIVPDMPVYLVGFIPVFVGVALLAYGYSYSPRD
jgi:mannose/fructose/N-acetylgalactosamine-specific phosphotransferase system component IIC